MSDRYPGGILSATAPEPVAPVDGEGGSAPGVWTMEQASYYEGVGQWPKPVLPRELYAWGANNTGQVGDNSVVSKSSPIQIGSITTWVQADQDAWQSTAIKADGTLWVWGNNESGQLGLNELTSKSSPVQVGLLTTWAQTEVGSILQAAIKTDGTLWAWGLNDLGQVGISTIQNPFVEVSSPIQIGSLTTWSQVTAGNDHCAAVKTDGTLWAWGLNSFGRLGDNTVVNKSSPVQVGALTTWSQVSAGSNFTGAVKTDGTLWMWGLASDGRLGDNNSATHKSSPVQIGALTNWSQVSLGSLHTTAIKTDGTLWAWGRNNFGGSVGDNTIINRSSPVQIGALTTWLQVNGGAYTSAATKTDGTLWSWGYNASGELGQNDIIFRSSPTQIGTGSWLQAAAGKGTMVAITKG